MTSICPPQSRKGVAWHKALLEGLLSGLQVTDGDRVIVVDVLPNRLPITHLFGFSQSLAVLVAV